MTRIWFSCDSFFRDEDTDTPTSISIMRTGHIVSAEVMATFLRILRIKNPLSPGKPGTVRLVEKYGDDVFCVR